MPLRTHLFSSRPTVPAGADQTAGPGEDRPEVYRHHLQVWPRPLPDDGGEESIHGEPLPGCPGLRRPLLLSAVGLPSCLPGAGETGPERLPAGLWLFLTDSLPPSTTDLVAHTSSHRDHLRKTELRRKKEPNVGSKLHSWWDLNKHYFPVIPASALTFPRLSCFHVALVVPEALALDLSL